MKKLICIMVLFSLFLCAIPAHAGVMIVTSTPTYDDSEEMEQNLDRAIEALNDKIIAKGQTFSFNEIVGSRSTENGFVTAPNGNGASVMGGGVAQIATTLHKALKELGGDVVYNEMHVFGEAFSAGYVDQAADAILTDYGRGLDYRFTSNHAENLSLSMWRVGSTVFCQLTGISTATVVPDATPGPESTATPQPSTEPTSEYETLYVVNVNSYVNLRNKPSTQAESVKQIPKDATVQFAGTREGDFLQVIYEGSIGYAHENYLSAQNPNPLMLTVINCNKSVTLRKAPSREAEMVAEITLGEVVEYIGDAESGFHQVKYDGKAGYVLAYYLSNPE